MSLRIGLLLMLLGAAFAQQKSRFTKEAGKVPQPAVVASDKQVKTLLSNSQVRVTRIDVRPSATTETVRHEYDFLLVSLGNNEFELAGPANSIPMSMHDGEVQVVTGRWSNRIVNKSASALHLVEVEVKRGIAPEKATCGLNAQPCKASRFAFNDTDRYVTGVLFETPFVRLMTVEIDPSSGMPEHGHTGGHLMIPLAEERLMNSVVGGRSTEISGQPGDSEWLAGVIVHSLRNLNATPVKFLTVELK